jgi:hypothetical protein
VRHIAIEAQKGQIGGRILPHQVRNESPAVGEFHFDADAAVHHVAVRERKPLPAHDHARTVHEAAARTPHGAHVQDRRADAVDDRGHFVRERAKQSHGT